MSIRKQPYNAWVKFLPYFALVLIFLAVFTVDAAPKRIGGIDLVWFWSDAEGEEGAHQGEEPINPASVVKLATTLWAFEQLGPDYRYLTEIAIDGEIDEENGVLRGDLYVRGGGDPDFHVENAQRMAATLHALGIRSVDGTLYVNDAFWIGWERGSEGTETNRTKRALLMAKRLQSAWNTRRWSRGTLAEMRRFREKHPGTRFLDLPVREIGGLGDNDTALSVATHRSNPLLTMLKRFNDYSNNDIERLGYRLGSPDQMRQFFVERWGQAAQGMSFVTLSGLGSSRMTPRQMARLVKELDEVVTASGNDLSDLLPALDCGRNTLRNYPGLQFPTGSFVGKTGTLVQTDGGVVALAGTVRTELGPIYFALAAPRNGARLTAARRAQVRWLNAEMGDRVVAAAECRPYGMRSYDSIQVERSAR